MASNQRFQDTTIGLTSYSCNVCKKSFQLTYMYACYHGHYLCKRCHKQICNPGIDKNDERFNLPEKSNRRLFNGDNEELDQKIRRVMFPNPNRFARKIIDTNSSLMSLATIYKPSLVNLAPSSKKPIQCPHHNCNKTIAVSALGTHFKHEHKHVAVISTQVESRNGLEFNFADLLGNVTNLCLVLINLGDHSELSLVDNGDVFPQSISSNFSKSSHLMTQIKPFFLVIAAKVFCNYGPRFQIDDEEINFEDEDCKFGPNDRIIFYATSNVITSFTYTIAVSTHDQSVRTKYYGPLPSLNEDFRKLCSEGKGLILNHYQINGMSENGIRPVTVDIIIHERDADTYDSDRD